MPPWLGVLTSEQIQMAVSHVRTFCQDDRWPRGELNLPRALVTGKAFPEDEAVVTVTGATEGAGSVVSRFVYEKRFGPVNQWEVAVPIGAAEGPVDGWGGGVGDIALGYKRVLAHSLARGNILSASAEVVLPTGDEDHGLGGGVTVFEPFLTFGQILPRNAFVQLQGGFEIPTGSDRDNEAFWRVAAGQSFEQARFGRTWSPMLEVLASRAMADGAGTDWDLVPQVQVSLNTRQHVLLNAGVRIPVTDADNRPTRIMVYLLWDWFDGGFLDGW
jgi:hypothetical protein